MNSFYQASPVEQAYSLYLVHQVFGTLLPLPNHSVINVSGRNAVPFLTQSGLDRGILRSVWNVADPQNFGSLTSIGQLHVVLRLVAMAQAGCLDPTQPMGTSLQNCASQQLPLPVFSNVMVPQADALMNMYGPYLATPQPPSVVGGMTSFSDANNSTQSGFAAGPKTLQSIDDAFGSMVEVQDAPLPSLASFPTKSPMIPATSPSDDDEFGDFGSAPTEPAPAAVESSSLSTMAPTPQPFVTDFGRALSEPISGVTSTNAVVPTSMSISDAFDGPFQDAPLPSLNALATTTAASEIPTTNQDVFPASTETTEGLTSKIGNEVNLSSFAETPPTGGISIEDAFSDMPIHRDAPLPSLASMSKTGNTPETRSQDFSDFGGATEPQQSISQTPDLVGSGNDEDDDDDFGDFGGASDQNQSTLQTPNVIGSGDDDFGDFGGASEPQQSVAQTPDLVGSGNDDFGDFEQKQSVSQEKDLFGSSNDDDFGDFGGATVPQQSVSQEKDLFGSSNDDDFGDFGGATLPQQSVSQTPNLVGSGDDDDFGDFGGATVPQQSLSQEKDLFGSSNDDDFGDFGDATVPQQSLSQEKDLFGSSNDDDFGDFGGATISQQSVSQEPNLFALDPTPIPPAMTEIGRTTSEPISTTSGIMGNANHVRSVSIDAFADLSAPEDAPLPSLEMYTAEAKCPTPQDAESPSASNTDAVSSGEDDFGDFTEGIQASNPTFHQETDDDEDDFGDFETTGAVISKTEPEVGPSLSITDAFDAMVTKDTSLPSLDALNDITKTGDVDTDDFGDFEAAGSHEAEETENDDVLPTTMPSTEIEASNNDDGSTNIGEGVSSMPNTVDNGPSQLILDPFGELSVPDEPLPSLMPTTSFAQESDGDNRVDKTSTKDTTINILDLYGSPPTVAPTSGPDLLTFSKPEQQATSDEANINGFRTFETAIPSNQSVIEEEDDFGDFGSAQPATVAVQPAQTMTSAGADDFGLFENAEVTTSQTLEVQDDDFGDFGGTTDRVEAGTSNFVGTQEIANVGNALKANEIDEDDFGDFGGANDRVESNDGADFDAFQQSKVHDEDVFGDFGGAKDRVESNDGADFDAFQQSNVHDEDDFGDFGGAKDRVESNDGADFDAFQQSNVHDEDDFGDFGGAKDRVESNDGADFDAFQQSNVHDEDDFGDFGGSTEVVESAAVGNFGAFQSANNEPSSDKGVQNGDVFGDFGGASNDVKSIAPVENYPPNDVLVQDEFGDFGDASDNVASADASTIEQDVGQENDNFGDFSSFTNKAATDQEVPTETDTTRTDSFGVFDSAEANKTSKGEITKDAEDHFGDFGGASENTPRSSTNFGVFETSKMENDDFEDFEGAQSTVVETQNEFGHFPSASSASYTEQRDQNASKDEDEFGDFGNGDFPTIEENDPVASVERSYEDIDEFGDFTVVEAPQNIDSEEDDDFGDFATFQAPESGHQSKAQKDDGDDNDDDWGDFEAVSAPLSETIFTEEMKIRDRIRSLGIQLPESVLRKTGVSGDHVDLGEAFEVNIGIKSSMTTASRRRAYRCIQVLESLTTKDNSKIASTFWEKIFGVVGEELDQAKVILAETESFSSDEWDQIRAPLSVFVEGLAEYMRIIRSIVASIGDVLLLDESTILTVDTFLSTWCSLSILEKPLECETKWTAIQKQLNKTPLSLVKPPTVEEIRSAVSSPQIDSSSAICHLTMQPLRKKDKGTTKEGVSFQGHNFMACSANFVVHRCPFFVIGDEL